MAMKRKTPSRISSTLMLVLRNIGKCMKDFDARTERYAHFSSLGGSTREGNADALRAEATAVILNPENRGASGSELRGLLKAKFSKILPGSSGDEMNRFVKAVVPDGEKK